MNKWIECKQSDVPANTRFDVPPLNQGQIVEVSYGGHSSQHREYDWSDAPFKREHDRSDNTVTYYRRAR